MTDKIYLYSNKNLFNFIKDILLDYEILPLTMEKINSSDFRNNSVLIVAHNDSIKNTNESFFLNNNVVGFFSKKDELDNLNKTNNTNFFYGQKSVKKFLDEIKTNFIFKRIVIKNIEIYGEKITNISLHKSLFLTPIEKEIMFVLFEKKKIKKEFFLEEILKIKKDIETKTIESHLTRIRRKLQKIKSDFQITARDDYFYLDL